MPVILSNSLLKLDDLSPLIRNTNDAGVLSVKAGPQGIAKDGAVFRMYFEAVGPTLTGPMLATAAQLQGPYTISPSGLVYTPSTINWENSEFSPSSVEADVKNNRWIIWGHGGNNAGPRKIGVLYSTDGMTGQAFTPDAGNPIVTIGTTGAFDDAHVADLKIKRVTTSEGDYLGFYRGTKADGTISIGRLVGSAPNSLTKTGQVILQGSGGRWNQTGSSTGAWEFDPGGRLHMIVAADSGGLGLFYSDDFGRTFTEYNNNPILVGGDVGSYDKAAGDVAQGLVDGDVLFVTYGGENIVDYPTNPPLRAIAAAITPWIVEKPAKPAKFYLGGTNPSTTITATSVLTQTTFSIAGRFRAFRLDRDSVASRTIYTEYAAFNIQVFCRVEGSGGGGTPGTLRVFIRTPTGICDMLSTGSVDDAAWHTFLVRRISAASFELWVDSTLVDTDATNISTDATATSKAVGNWTVASAQGDEPSLCAISDLVIVHGTALTLGEAQAAITSRAFPSGVVPTVSFPRDGTDVSNAVTVEGAVGAAPVVSSYAKFPKAMLVRQ